MTHPKVAGEGHLLLAFAAALVGALYVLSLTRGLPRRKAVALGCGAAAFIAVGLITALAYGRGAKALELGTCCIFGAFILVTRVRVIRAADSQYPIFADVPQDFKDRYMTHPARHQVAGLVLGLSIWTPLALGLGYVGR